MERLVERETIPRKGTGYIQKRRSAISDAVVNYLLAVLLEGYDHLSERAQLYHLPTSLCVLLREQLCGANPDMYGICLSRKRREEIQTLVADRLQKGEKLTVRRLMKISGTARMSAARLLRDREFRVVRGLGLAPPGGFPLGDNPRVFRAALRRVVLAEQHVATAAVSVA